MLYHQIILHIQSFKGISCTVRVVYSTNVDGSQEIRSASKQRCPHPPRIIKHTDQGPIIPIKRIFLGIRSERLGLVWRESLSKRQAWKNIWSPIPWEVEITKFSHLGHLVAWLRSSSTFINTLSLSWSHWDLHQIIWGRVVAWSLRGLWCGLSLSSSTPLTVCPCRT